MSRLAASRISSVFGLKVRPSTATVLPLSSPPHASMILSAIRFLRWALMSIVVSISRTGAPYWRAVLARRTDQVQRILENARPAATRPRVEHLAADAPVETDPARHVVHIGA